MKNLYTDDSFDTGVDRSNYTGAAAQIDWYIEELRKTKKKNKKLKKQLRAKELEFEQYEYLLMHQQAGMARQRPVQWQRTIEKCVPKLFDMGIVVLSNVTKKRPPTMSEKNRNQLFLDDGSDK